MFPTLSQSQVRNLALAAATSFNKLAGERWLYYPSDILQHWQPGASVLDVVQALRQAGDHTLAVLLADAGGLDDEQASTQLLSPSPAHCISRREMAYRLTQVEHNWTVPDALRCFWDEQASIQTIVVRMQRAGQEALAQAFERELLLFADDDTPRPCEPGKLPQPPLLPRLLDGEQAVAIARQIVHELGRVGVECSEAEILAFWQDDWPVLSIDLLMREAGEHLMALLFEELALYGAELSAVLQAQRPSPQDTLSQRDARRIARVMKDCTGLNILALWVEGMSIEALAQRVSVRFGRRAAHEFSYWARRHPGYDTWPVGEEPLEPALAIPVTFG